MQKAMVIKAISHASSDFDVDSASRLRRRKSVAIRKKIDIEIMTFESTAKF